MTIFLYSSGQQNQIFTSCVEGLFNGTGCYEENPKKKKNKKHQTKSLHNTYIPGRMFNQTRLEGVTNGGYFADPEKVFNTLSQYPWTCSLRTW